MNFKSEQAFRSHLLSILPSCYRIEAVIGSTSGLPDLFFYPSFGIQVFLELKHVPTFQKRPKFTPAQLITIPRMLNDGANVMTMVAATNDVLHSGI